MVKLADISFDHAVQKCLAIEQASKDYQVLQGEQGPGVVNILDTSKYGEDQASPRSPKKTQGSRGKGSKQLKLCYRRTGSHHSQKRPFIKARCYHCGITGHTQQACREKKATQQTNDSEVNVMKRADSDESDGEYRGGSLPYF